MLPYFLIPGYYWFNFSIDTNNTYCIKCEKKSITKQKPKKRLFSDEERLQ